MILLAWAAAIAMQWTGPRTEEYRGPGYFCGGGYTIRLKSGERALVLPQSISGGVQGVRLILQGREINIWSGDAKGMGRIVARVGGSIISEQDGAADVQYTVADQTDFALRMTSRGFRGFQQDTWFFGRANFNASAEKRVRCLAAISN